MSFESPNTEAAQTVIEKQAHVCPCCLRPWFDENGKFAACKRCPFRSIEATRIYNDVRAGDWS